MKCREEDDAWIHVFGERLRSHQHVFAPYPCVDMIDIFGEHDVLPAPQHFHRPALRPPRPAFWSARYILQTSYRLLTDFAVLGGQGTLVELPNNVLAVDEFRATSNYLSPLSVPRMVAGLL